MALMQSGMHLYMTYNRDKALQVARPVRAGVTINQSIFETPSVRTFLLFSRISFSPKVTLVAGYREPPATQAALHRVL